MNVWQSVRRSGGLQIAVAVVSGTLGIVTSRIIITHFGLAVYGQYGLLTSMPSLLPFADLGVAAVIVNNIAASRDPRRDEVVRATLTSAFRILFMSAAALTALSLVLLVTGSWPVILGDGLLPGGSVVASACLLLFALGLPLAVGQRLLVALGRTPVQVATQLVIAPTILVGTVLIALTGTGDGRWTPVLPFIGIALSLALGLSIAARLVQPQVGEAFRATPRLRSSPGVPVLHLAWPMLVQMVALPIAMQTGRIVLSHRGDTAELAEYNLASQLFGVVLGGIAMAGLALWPWFARGRSEDTRHRPWRASAVFAGVGLVGGLGVAVLSPFLAQLASGGRVTLGPVLVAAFVVFIVLQATKYPVGMYMTDREGLRFQVLPIVLMVPSNIALAWVLVPVAGAAAPVAACSVGVLVFQVIPNAFWVRRDLARERSAPQLVLP